MKERHRLILNMRERFVLETNPCVTWKMSLWDWKDMWKMRRFEDLYLCYWRSDILSYHLYWRRLEFILIFFSCISVLLVCTLSLSLTLFLSLTLMLLIMMLILLKCASSMLMITGGVPLIYLVGFVRRGVLLFVLLRLYLPYPCFNLILVIVSITISDFASCSPVAAVFLLSYFLVFHFGL